MKQQGWPSNSAQAFLLSLQENEAFGHGISRAQCSKECCNYHTFLLLVIFGQLAGICHQLSATARLITKHGPKDVNHHSKEHQYSRSTYPVSYGRSRKKKRAGNLQLGGADELHDPQLRCLLVHVELLCQHLDVDALQDSRDGSIWCN